MIRYWREKQVRSDAFEKITLHHEAMESNASYVPSPVFHAVKKLLPNMKNVTETAVESAHNPLCHILEGKMGKTYTTLERFLNKFVDQKKNIWKVLFTFSSKYEPLRSLFRSAMSRSTISRKKASQFTGRKIFVKQLENFSKMTKMVIAIQATIVDQNAKIYVQEALRSRIIHHEATMEPEKYSTMILLVA